MKKFIPLGLLFIIVLLGLTWLIKGDNLEQSSVAGKTYAITLDDNGFHPDQITIKKGDTITFKTIVNKPFWPASDFHPTHLLYPEFDPKDAIMPNKTWSFKFEKVGLWSFHDHLAPYLVGKIRVLAE